MKGIHLAIYQSFILFGTTLDCGTSGLYCRIAKGSLIARPKAVRS